MKYHLLFIFYITLSLTSCYSDREDYNEQLIEMKVEEAIRGEIKQYQIKCLNDLLYEAEVFADSLVIQQIAYSINDTLNFPGRPIRPNFPHPIILDDSTKLNPVLMDSIIRYLEQRSLSKNVKVDSLITTESDTNSL